MSIVALIYPNNQNILGQTNKNQNKNRIWNTASKQNMHFTFTHRRYKVHSKVEVGTQGETSKAKMQMVLRRGGELVLESYISTTHLKKTLCRELENTTFISHTYHD